MEDINKENLPKNAKKENPTEEELVSRMLKKEAMAKYRKRLKEGKVDGPVNKYGQIIQQVNTQIDHNIIEDFREKLKTLNKENETNFTSSEMLSHILKTILPAIQIKKTGRETTFFIDDGIIQFKNLEKYMTPKDKATKEKKLKI